MYRYYDLIINININYTLLKDFFKAFLKKYFTNFL